VTVAEGGREAGQVSSFTSLTIREPAPLSSCMQSINPGRSLHELAHAALAVVSHQGTRQTLQPPSPTVTAQMSPVKVTTRSMDVRTCNGRAWMSTLLAATILCIGVAAAEKSRPKQIWLTCWLFLPSGSNATAGSCELNQVAACGNEGRPLHSIPLPAHIFHYKCL